jgi:hypothetical protein
MLQVVMPNDDEQGNLNGMHIGVDGTKISSYHVEPNKSLMVNLTESTPKSDYSGWGKDDGGKYKFETILCTKRTTNDVYLAFSSVFEETANCYRHDRHQNEEILVLPSKQELNPFQDYDIGTQSSDVAIKSSTENGIEGYNSLDSYGVLDT